MPKVGLIFKFQISGAHFIEGGSSSSSCGKAQHLLVRFQKQKHVITLSSFFYFQIPTDTSKIHRKAWTGARIDGSKYTHTPTHTAADDSYKYHRTRVRSDSYTILLYIYTSIYVQASHLQPAFKAAANTIVAQSPLFVFVLQNIVGYKN